MNRLGYGTLRFARACDDPSHQGFSFFSGFSGKSSGALLCLWGRPLFVLDRFLAAKLDFRFHPQANALSKPGFAFWIICLYALAGWLSGLVGALIYSFFSKHLGLQEVTSAGRLSD